MICLIEWCNSNQGFLSAVLSILTVSVSLIVMWCSNRNAATILKKQQKQEKEIELRQEDMQRRQIKVDTYPYRLECWKTLYRIKDVVEILKLGFEEKVFYEKDYKNLYDFYKRLFETRNCMPDTIILSLKQAQSVFPVSTWKCVNDIILKNYLIINNAFEGFNAFETLLEEDQKQAVKTAKLLEIETAVKNILPEIKGIILKVDIDLCIADLHEVRGIYNDGLKYEDDFEKEVKND